MIRELVRRLQFTEDTTIDGNRLDGFMQAFVDRFNALQPRDLERNWTETTFVTGYQPAKAAATYGSPALPWLNPINRDADSVDSSLFYPTNFYRSKGWGVPWLPLESTTADYYWQWGSSFHVHKPTIITKIMFVMRTDNEFVNAFSYGASPPPGKANGNPSDDFALELSIDNPFTQENRSQANTEVLRTRFPADAWEMNAAISADMHPNYPAGAGANPGGVYVNLDVEVPVPQNARVRLNLIIPQYTGGIFDSTWGDETSYLKQYYSVAISMLEKS